MSTDVQDTLNQRQNVHGDFQENGRVMQLLKESARFDTNYLALEPYKREAIDMILHKIGRIVTGDSNHVDHWHDVAGYATLVENILTTGNSHIPPSTN